MLNRKSFIREIIIYLFTWLMTAIIFWTIGKNDTMGYALMNFHIVLPVITFFISMMIAKSGSTHQIYLIPLFLALMVWFAPYVIFDLLNAMSFNKSLPYIPDRTGLGIGLTASVLGIIVGLIQKK